MFEFSNQYLLDHFESVYHIPSIDRGGQSKDTVGGLEKDLYLSVGCKVYITSNLFSKAGLFNSAFGKVRACIYMEGEAPPSMPVGVVVEMDEVLLQDKDCFMGLKNHVLVEPIDGTEQSARSCTRVQLPLKLGYSLTVHKSQGLTLQQVVLDWGKKDAAMG